VLAAVLLFANALFNVIAWPRFYPRIASDPRARDADGRRTRFYTVHVVLIVIALVRRGIRDRRHRRAALSPRDRRPRAASPHCLGSTVSTRSMCTRNSRMNSVRNASVLSFVMPPSSVNTSGENWM